MTLYKEEFEKIKSRYQTLLIIHDDVEDAFHFILEVMEAEVNAIRNRVPYATHDIDKLEAGIHELWSMTNDVENECFGEY